MIFKAKLFFSRMITTYVGNLPSIYKYFKSDIFILLGDALVAAASVVTSTVQNRPILDPNDGLARSGKNLNYFY